MTDSVWRFCIASPVRTADGMIVTSIPIISWLDRLASERSVTLTLNEPWEITGSVPSDDPRVNLGYPGVDDDSYLAEGERVIMGFRKGFGEGEFSPAAHGIVLDLQDVANGDTARSIYTALDGWAYLFSRPCLDTNGKYPGDFGLVFEGMEAGQIALQVLGNSIYWHGDVMIDAGIPYWGTTFWNGVIQTTDLLEGWVIEQGTTVGQAWMDLVQTGHLDIVLQPIYDIANRPGYLWELSIYQRAGTWRHDAVFAWDMPGHSLVGMQRGRDGRERENKIRFHNGQGGPNAGQVIDAASIQRFGLYHGEQFFPKQKSGAGVSHLANEHLARVKNGPEVVTLSPATGRQSPDPFTAYTIGDIVTGWASRNFRTPFAEYKRVLQIPISLDDNGTETVDQLVVQPFDGPPIETELMGTDTSTFTALRTARDKGTRKFTQGKSWGGRY